MSTDADRLRALLDRIREEKIAPVMAYAIAPVMAYAKNPTMATLRGIFDSVVLEGDALIARDLLAMCRSRSGCGLYGCRTCGQRLKKKHSWDGVKMMIARVRGMPTEDEVSYVTIDGPTCVLEPFEARSALRRFLLRLKNLWRLKLPDTAWHGFVDVTLDGMIHFHGVIWHPERTKDALGNTLRKAFTKKNAIMIKPWDKGKTLLANMEGVLQYALPTDRHVPRRKYGRRKGEPIVDERTGERIVKRMVALQHMCQRGVQGIRLSFNMRTTCVWKAGVLFDKETRETIIIPEMEARILARRRSGPKWDRPNRPALPPRRRATEKLLAARRQQLESQYGYGDESMDDHGN
jgi:hypothetical protein